MNHTRSDAASTTHATTATTDGALEVVAFRCKPGHAAEARQVCAEAVAEASAHGGVLGDVLYQSADDENLFVHQVRWRSLEDARRVAALFPTFACAPAFKRILAAHVLMTHCLPATG